MHKQATGCVHISPLKKLLVPQFIDKLHSFAFIVMKLVADGHRKSTETSKPDYSHYMNAISDFMYYHVPMSR